MPPGLPNPPPDGPKQVIEATITMANPPAPKTGVDYTELLGHTAALLKAIAWPAVILYLFVQLRDPLMSSAGVLPELLRKSSEIGVGSFSMKVQQTAVATGNPELGNLVRGLSASAVDALLNAGRAYHAVAGSSRTDPTFVSLPDASSIATLRELEAKGLLRFQEPWDDYARFIASLPLKRSASNQGHDEFTLTRALSEAESKRLRAQQYFLSDSGRLAFELVIKSIAGLVNPSS